MATEPMSRPLRRPTPTTDVPDGAWEPIRRVCARVMEDAPRIADRILRAVYDEIPQYLAAGAPREDVAREARRHLLAMLDGIAQRRPPTDAELEVRAAVGRRRAEQGVPAEDLLRAFHIGYRELWGALVAEAELETGASVLLVKATSIAWGWVQVESSVAAEAHKEVTRSHELTVIQRSSRLLEALLLGDLTSPAVAELTRSLGMDPEGVFTALRLHADRDLVGDAHRVQQVLNRVAGIHLCLPRGSDLIVMTQLDDPAPAVAALTRALPDAAVGIGLRRSGLRGARLSVEDADLCLTLAAPGQAVTFDEEWFTACLAGQIDRLRPLLEVGLAAARGNAHLVEALTTYTNEGFSKVRTAEVLVVHPHTVSYRLDRWRTLTGWDVATVGGLMLTVAALRLLDVPGATAAPPAQAASA